MNWLGICASEVGTSHVQACTGCQDHCLVEVNLLEGDQSLLTIFLADGAGSASHGGEGAKLAVEAAAAFIATTIEQQCFEISDSTAIDILVAARTHIAATAEAQGLTTRDYASTFIGVLSCSAGTLVMQIGDGGVVLDTGAGLELAVIPMSGEYANMTHFATDDDALSKFETKTYQNLALKVAAFTDGLQRLALNMAEGSPHEPFFSPFFNGMAKATIDQEAHLPELLAGFLQSPAVNERTDDDKTLALALWKSSQISDEQ